MRRCILFCTDFGGEWEQASADGWELCRIKNVQQLRTLEQVQGSLLCWSAESTAEQLAALKQFLQEHTALYDTACLAFGKTRAPEQAMLEMGADDYILLPCAPGVLKLRAENAVLKKALICSTREKMWMSFAYQANAFEDALFICELDAATGHAVLLKASSIAQNELYPFAEYDGTKTGMENFHPDDRARVAAAMQPETLQKNMRAGAGDTVLTFRIRDRQGYWVWVENRRHFETDLMGRVHCFCLIRAVQKTLIEKAIYEEVIRDNVFAILTINLKEDTSRQLYVAGRDVGMSPRCYSANYKAFLNALILPADVERAIHDLSPEGLKKHLGGHEAYMDHYAARLHDGTLHRFSIEEFYSEKAQGLIVVVIKEITQLYVITQKHQKEMAKALRAAENANRAKSEFLSRMSHDIRTPMNAIINLTRLARDDRDDAAQLMTDLEKIELSSTFLLGLINDILDMSRIDSGRMELHPHPYTSNRFAAYIESVIVPLCTEKKIHFLWKKTKNAFPLYVDETRFNQVFFNVLSNAVKYTDEGGEISFLEENRCVKDGVLSADFIIRDNGCGMTEEFQKKLFQPFERADEVESYTGTGLGLCITKNIVDKMGGTIKINSKHGVGTEVWIHLAVPIATPEQMAQHNGNAEELTPACGQRLLEGCRILVAEDHPLNREIVTRILHKRGIAADCVGNGKEAVEKLKNSAPGYYTLILMDVRMPVMDGVAATKEIRALHDPQLAGIPIVAMTADAFSSDIQKCLDAGMDEYLAKPLDVAQLFCTVEHIFAAQSAAR